MDGTGDHENYFDKNEKQLDVLISEKTYSCTKKAVKIRTVDTHKNWPNCCTNKTTILFSKLTKSGLEFFLKGSLDAIENDENDKKVKYHSSVKAEYGLVKPKNNF